jgi:hypothetical protein
MGKPKEKRIEKSEKKGNEKPLSLYPLSFEDAVKEVLKAKSPPGPVKKNKEIIKGPH